MRYFNILSGITGPIVEPFAGPKGLVHLFKIFYMVGFWLMVLGPIIWWILIPTRKKWYPRKYLKTFVLAFVITFSAIAILASISILLKPLKPLKIKEAERNTTKKVTTIKIYPWPQKPSPKGSTYKTNGLGITINNVRKATGKEEGFLGPPSGPNPNLIYVGIAVNLTIKNVSSEPKEYPTMYILPLKIIDSEGNEFSSGGILLSEEKEKEEPDIFSESAKLSPGEKRTLPSGQEITGNVWFSVWEKSTGLKLVYDVPGEKLTWKLE